uniref:Uncharacterized protein n=1 Tax=Timema cristinae TaxID=61476 RepID=A0A7R9CBC3_TIMCR|nr:unnamed protein product [Timema cristinae]
MHRSNESRVNTSRILGNPFTAARESNYSITFVIFTFHSSQQTQHVTRWGIRKAILKKEVYQHFHEGIVANNFGKTTLSTPSLDSNLDLPVIGSLVYCESSALDHVATETRRVENHLRKTTFSTPDRDLNPDLLVISHVVNCESNALDHGATGAGLPLALSDASLKPILWKDGRESESRGVASQPTRVSFRANKNRWITETVDGSSYRTGTFFTHILRRSLYWINVWKSSDDNSVREKEVDTLLSSQFQSRWRDRCSNTDLKADLAPLSYINHSDINFRRKRLQGTYMFVDNSGNYGYLLINTAVPIFVYSPRTAAEARVVIRYLTSEVKFYTMDMTQTYVVEIPFTMPPVGFETKAVRVKRDNFNPEPAGAILCQRILPPLGLVDI